MSSSYAIVVPVASERASAAELDTSLESLLENLSESLGAALQRELGNLT